MRIFFLSYDKNIAIWAGYCHNLPMLAVHEFMARVQDPAEPPVDIIMDVAESIFVRDKKAVQLLRFCKVNKVDPKILYRSYGFRGIKGLVKEVEGTAEEIQQRILSLRRMAETPEAVVAIGKLAAHSFFSSGHENYRAIRAQRKIKANPKFAQLFDENADRPAVIRALTCQGVSGQELVDLGLRIPFGQILEEYVSSGGRDFGDFLHVVAIDWGLSMSALGVELGVQNDAIQNWTNMNKLNRRAPVNSSLVAITGQLDDITNAQVDLLYALKEGGLSNIWQFDQFVSSLCLEMLETPQNLRSLYGNTVLAKLIKRSGRYVDEIAGAADCSAKFIKSQVGSNKARTSRAVPIIHKIVKALVPVGASNEVVRDIALLVIGIPAYRSPEKLLSMVEQDKITTGEMVREYRMGLGLSADEFGQKLGGLELSYVSACERTPQAKAILMALRAVANHMGLGGRDQRVFIQRANGLKGIKADNLVALIQGAHKGEKPFSDIVQYVLRAEFAVKADRNAGQTELARALQTGPANVHAWFKGAKHMQSREVAERFAELIRVPEDFISMFAEVAMNKIISYNPSVIYECDPFDFASRCELFRGLMSDGQLSGKVLAGKLGVTKRVIEGALNKGYWRSTKVSIDDVAAALIPEKYQEDRAKFVEIWGSPIPVVKLEQAFVVNDDGGLSELAV